MRTRFLPLAICLVTMLCPALGRQAPKDLGDPVALALANRLLATLTLEEKVSLCRGDGTMSLNAIPKIGLTERFWMSDGPNNVRVDLNDQNFRHRRPDSDPSEQSTALPRLSVLAQTWSRDLAFEYGKVIGEEARARGKDMMLGPGVNMVRTPLCGRDMEYLAEDPYLAAQLAVPEIRGIQSCDVAACVKHFALNNQELNRNGVDVEVDDRTLREIYLPAFEAAVKEGGVLTLMGAYNRVRGEYCCQNGFLLNEILKKEWGFPGFVVSDWGATHETIPSALGGLDVEMKSGPGACFNKPLLEAVTSGTVPMEALDDKVRRVLYVMAKIHKIDGKPRQGGSINTAEHQALAERVAEEGIVLLKNDSHVLPLDANKIKTLLVIGSAANVGTSSFGGSSEGNPPFEVTPLEGIRHLLGDRVKVDFEAPDPDFTFGRSRRAKGNSPKGVGTMDPQELALLAARARAADAVLFFIADRGEGEGEDRPDMGLPAGMNEALTAVLAARPDAVVIDESGAPVAMPWAGQAHALVQYGFSGMEGGDALARVVFGEANPSGRLAVTFPRRLEDSPAHALRNYNATRVNYAEGVFMGYRWFDAKRIEPQFPFGFGLSYTTFEISKLRVSAAKLRAGEPLKVTAEVKNTGNREGAEVVQLYVGDPSALVPRPSDELKGFEKVMLKPGETKVVEFDLDSRAFSYWNVKDSNWTIDPGSFSVLVGDSSRNLNNRASVTFF